MLVALAASFSYLGYAYARFQSLRITSESLVRIALPFERPTGHPVILILGDSLGVGVGAEKLEESIAGRLGSLYPQNAIENHAVSGARIADLPAQLAEVKRSEYAFILIHIGANDIIRFRQAGDAARELSAYLSEAKKLSPHVIFLTAGDVGRTRFFPWFLNPYYHRATLRYHAEFARIAGETGTTYVNLYKSREEDLFTKDPKHYYSADMLHPSGEGYALWFEEVQKVLP